MLKALLADCGRMPSLKVQLMLDSRCQALAAGYPNTTIISAHDDAQQVFEGLLASVDAVWLVAPEFDGILESWTVIVEAAGKQLLTTSAAAVSLTADKWRTCRCLQAAGISAMSTALLTEQSVYRAGEWVIKPIDGAGCADTWRVANAEAFKQTLDLIHQSQNFIIQPYVEGRPMSLSCLFHQGQGWVLCVNGQVMGEQAHRLKLLACQVNCMPVTAAHERLVAQLAKAIPGLHGYVGIDFIQSPYAADEYWVVEINPRLTSSYVGIHQALGLNVVELVLQMAHHAPVLQPLRNVAVEVNLV